MKQIKSWLIIGGATTGLAGYWFSLSGLLAIGALAVCLGFGLPTKWGK